jgi:hypothetical protein
MGSNAWQWSQIVHEDLAERPGKMSAHLSGSQCLPGRRRLRADFESLGENLGGQPSRKTLTIRKSALWIGR